MQTRFLTKSPESFFPKTCPIEPKQLRMWKSILTNVFLVNSVNAISKDFSYPETHKHITNVYIDLSFCIRRKKCNVSVRLVLCMSYVDGWKALQIPLQDNKSLRTGLKCLRFESMQNYNTFWANHLILILADNDYFWQHCINLKCIAAIFVVFIFHNVWNYMQQTF